MKRLVVVATPTTLLAELLLFGLSDTVTSIAGASIGNNELRSNVGEANNSPASAAITITLTRETKK